MPGAFGHLVGVWTLIKLINRFKKIAITRLMWAALLLGAILPDADFLVDWTIDDIEVHRTFTHSVFAMIIGGFAVYFILQFFSRLRNIEISRQALVALLFSFGIFTHLLLDLSTSESGVQVLWPFSDLWVTFNGPLNHIDGTPTYEQLKWFVTMSTVDMAIGTVWIAYLFWKKKIEL